MEQLTHS